MNRGRHTACCLNLKSEAPNHSREGGRFQAGGHRFRKVHASHRAAQRARGRYFNSSGHFSLELWGRSGPKFRTSPLFGVRGFYFKLRSVSPSQLCDLTRFLAALKCKGLALAARREGRVGRVQGLGPQWVF